MAHTVLMPTTIVSNRSYTVEQVEGWNEPGRFEIVDGVLFMAATPFAPHSDIVTNLLVILEPWVRSHKLGKVYPAQTGLYYTETNYLDPDLIFVSRSQRPRWGQRATAATLAVEVLSPSNLRAPREDRERLFRRIGVQELWYIDSETRSMEVRRLTSEGYATTATFGEADLVCSELFPGLEFPLSVAWEDVEE